VQESSRLRYLLVKPGVADFIVGKEIALVYGFEAAPNKAVAAWFIDRTNPVQVAIPDLI
jgi:hypothetical protein